MKLYYILASIIVVHSASYAALSSLPTTMQSKRVVMYSTPSTNIIGATFTRTYDNSLVIATSGTYNPIGFICLSSLDFTPSSSEGFWCRSQTIGTNTITILCTIRTLTTINQMSYYYAVFSSSEFIYTYGSSTFTRLLAEQVDVSSWSGASGNKYSSLQSGNFNTNSLAYYRGLVFLRGIEHVLNINFGMNMSVSCYSGVYYLYFTLPTGIAINAASISKVYVSVLIFDVGYFQIKKNFIIQEGITTYFGSSQTTTVPTSIDLNRNMMIIGIRSIYFTNNLALSFSFNYSTADIGFPSSSLFSQVQYFWISVKSCNPGSYIQRVSSMCKNERNGCTTYYESIPPIGLTAANPVTGLKVHISLKIFVMTSNYEVRLYRHNGNNFVYFTNFSIPFQISTITKIIPSSDFSRLSILCSTCGFFVYAWNNTAYFLQYTLPSMTVTFMDFDISNDFRMITIIYYRTAVSTTKQITLNYNSTLRDYQIGPQNDASSAIQMYINYAKGEAYTLYDRYLNFLNYSSTFNFYVAYSPRLDIYEPSSPVTSAISGNKKVLAIDATRKELEPGIRIYHYSDTLQYFVYHSRIRSMNMQSFGMLNNLKLSQDGLKLLVKSISGSAESIVYFSRSSLTNEFTLFELITQPESTQNFDSTSKVIQSSNSMEFILKSDYQNNIVLYYCQSAIANITSLYQIPQAPSLYVEPIDPTDVKLDELNQKLNEKTAELGVKINNIKIEIDDIKLETQDIKVQISDIKNVIDQILPLILVLIIAIVFVIGLLVFKMIKDAILKNSSNISSNIKQSQNISIKNKGRIQNNNIQQHQDRQNNSKAQIARQNQYEESNTTNIDLRNLKQIRVDKKKKKRRGKYFTQKSLEIDIQYQDGLQLED